MTWFKQISVKEYDELIKNKNKIYNITPNFSSVELLNKYRDDDDVINKKIIIDENLDKQNKNLVKEIDKNLNKYLIEKPDISKYKDQYTFKNNYDILNSFIKIFTDYDLSYKPRSKTTEVSSQYLLNKLEKSKKIPKELFQYFDNNLRDKKKLNLKFKFKFNYPDDIPLIPENIDYDDEDDEDDDNNSITPIEQQGGTLNNIKIDKNALNKNILKIRYLNGRKLNNKLLKHDYKITKNMKEAVKFNKNICKLSQNEKNIYYELEKYINKDKSLDILIGSYLSGNNNKKSFNRINKILYDKYKNNLITQKEYTNMLKRINKT